MSWERRMPSFFIRLRSVLEMVEEGQREHLPPVRLRRATLRLIESQTIAKGNVLATARIAGISAAKHTANLIPLCHPLAISHCEVSLGFPATGDRIVLTAVAKVTAPTGVEMEALTAVAVAALTIYDMCKAVDKMMRITDIHLVAKSKRSVDGKGSPE